MSHQFSQSIYLQSPTNNHFMEKSLVVTSVMSKLSLPKTELENNINRRYKNRKLYFVDIALPGFENISWRFLNTRISGEVEIVFTNKNNKETICLDIPITTRFLACCTKRDHRGYKLTFGISLS